MAQWRWLPDKLACLLSPSYPVTMTFVILAATGLFAAPEWIPTAIEYPAKAMRKQVSAAAFIDVVVDPEGLQVRCKTLRVFGDEKLGASICKIQKSWHYEPAKNELGEATYGIVRTLVKFTSLGTPEGDRINKIVTFPSNSVVVTAQKLPIRNHREEDDGSRLLVDHSYMIINVSALPGTDRNYLDKQVVVAVDTDGMVTTCRPAIDDQSGDDHAPFEAVACEQLKSVKIGQVAGSDGLPTSFVRTLSVRFALVPAQ